ncbi:MAG TPA: phosphoribosylaminoimidazolesuccinocarboxamide synthase [Candidatus Agrococcus pullicola]|uniref:Phosphoribosylaminoimidazole-succinocarboxamide synthase n=1 Tax=Candidatus Agrococcus pullicola TaxID=2838429 RepID=A0A9D1YXY1_9MICO|nr:phosphoribosylaminoimidazolesuccinocarboxamide synthase [Candidatus Agrococcus pullicola]
MNLTGYELAYSGKVRDLFVPVGETLTSADRLLMVASDRVSAFDHVLEPAIPGKGAALTSMTRWWSERLDLGGQFLDVPVPEQVADRAVLVKSLDMLPVECVVRGRVTGSGLQEYLATGAISGVELPWGLADGDELVPPVFTPAWKAPQGEHDENIPFERVVELVGEEAAEEIRERSLSVFSQAVKIAASKGLVLADTKFEFGRDRETGEIVLADEILTSDSSRYWDAEALQQGRIESFDKQIVRNWLSETWGGEGAPPELPEAIVRRTSDRYAELLSRLQSD